MDARLCIRCKGGRNLCGRGYCEVLMKAKRVMPAVKFDSARVFGMSPPSVFVGRHSYPDVLAGPMLPNGEHDSPEQLDLSSAWYGRSMEELVAMSSSLLRPVQRVRVNRPFSQGRFLEVTHGIAMSSAPVETEVQLEKVPLPSRGIFDFQNVPMGPSVVAKRAKLTQNPKVPRSVDYIVSDTDVKATTAMKELAVRKVDEHAIQKILSVGLLGRKSARRLVPTRWAITAVDDTLGKAMVPKVIHNQEVGEFHLYTETFHGNHFHVLFIPGPWSFEMKESWLSGAMWTDATAAPPAPLGDYEDHRGRKTYASNVTGAYYAARLAVLEKLAAMQRCASVLVYREITDDYWAPLGVWVIREAVRNALKKKPRTYDTLSASLSAIAREVRVKRWARRSRILENRKKQRRIEDFLTDNT